MGAGNFVVINKSQYFDWPRLPNRTIANVRKTSACFDAVSQGPRHVHCFANTLSGSCRIVVYDHNGNARHRYLMESLASNFMEQLQKKRRPSECADTNSQALGYE